MSKRPHTVHQPDNTIEQEKVQASGVTKREVIGEHFNQPSLVVEREEMMHHSDNALEHAIVSGSVKIEVTRTCKSAVELIGTQFNQPSIEQQTVQDSQAASREVLDEHFHQEGEAMMYHPDSVLENAILSGSVESQVIETCKPPEEETTDNQFDQTLIVEGEAMMHHPDSVLEHAILSGSVKIDTIGTCELLEDETTGNQFDHPSIVPESGAVQICGVSQRPSSGLGHDNTMDNAIVPRRSFSVRGKCPVYFPDNTLEYAIISLCCGQSKGSCAVCRSHNAMLNTHVECCCCAAKKEPATVEPAVVVQTFEPRGLEVIEDQFHQDSIVVGEESAYRRGRKCKSLIHHPDNTWEHAIVSMCCRASKKPSAVVWRSCKAIEHAFVSCFCCCPAARRRNNAVKQATVSCCCARKKSSAIRFRQKHKAGNLFIVLWSAKETSHSSTACQYKTAHTRRMLLLCKKEKTHRSQSESKKQVCDSPHLEACNLHMLLWSFKEVTCCSSAQQHQRACSCTA